MNHQRSINQFVHDALSILLLLVAINAFAGGYYGMTGARQVPVTWLRNSPFTNYFIPGLILFVCVGGSALFAAFTVLKENRLAETAAIICALILLTWLVVQVVFIGFVSWLQPVMAVVAIAILLLTWQHHKYEQ